MCKSLCSGLVQLVLGTINLIFLVIGAGLVTLGGVIKFGNFDLTTIIKNQELQNVLGAVQLDGDTVPIGLLVLGTAVLFISFVGLVGVCCTSRFFLTVYELVVGILFVSHLILFVLAVGKRTDLAPILVKFLNDTVTDVDTNYSANSKLLTAKCNLLQLVSNLGNCCDFASGLAREDCCKTDVAINSTSCVKATEELFKGSYFEMAVVVPNAAVLAFEVTVLLVVPCLIVRFGKNY
jgi:hypothetical protein